MATIYIDPSLAANGDGSLATPFNTWVGITWTAGNTYLQKRGTTFITAVGSGGRIAPSVSGTKDARITIASYGDGDYAPRIYNRADTGFNLDRRSFITLRGFIIDCTEATASGIGISGDTATESDGIIVDGNEIFGGTLVTGISAQTQANRLTTRNCIITNNYVHDCGYHGILVAGSHVNTVVRNNIIKRVGSGIGAHGLSSFVHRQFISRSWTLVSGNIYKTTIGAQSFLTTVTDIYGVSYATTGRTLAKAASAAAPALNEYGFTGGELYINVGGLPTGIVGIGYTSLSVVFDNNFVEGVVDFDGNEGTGIQLDDFASNSIISRNTIKNCQGFGVNINYGRSNKVFSNVVINCDKAAIRLGTNGAELNEAFNNYARSSTVSMSGEAISLGRNNKAQNNALDNYTTGVAGLSDSTESHNFRNNGAAVSGGISEGTGTALVASLLVNASGMPLPSSPLLTDGADINWQRDKDGILGKSYIGAYSTTGVATERGVR